jgi:hypothetical protein
MKTLKKLNKLVHRIIPAVSNAGLTRIGLEELLDWFILERRPFVNVETEVITA